MYKLVYFKATNVSGFMSGLGKKTFELDLHELYDKDIITILGNNATGKSTLLSLIHPWHTPTDKRSNFILQGREGVIIREYQGDDRTTILTKIIYKPKKDGHSPKCYISIDRGDGNVTELNPNGNVSSYYDMVYTYFGIRQDYINFASYNDAVDSIVKMTDTERKMKIVNLIPNTHRFEIAYETINNKYKELRSLIRNVTQKITMLKDEETMRADIKRFEKRLNDMADEREKYLSKIGKIEGRFKEMFKNTNIDKVLKENRDNDEQERSYQVELSSLKVKIRKLCDKLGFACAEDSIQFKGMDRLHDTIYDLKIHNDETAKQIQKMKDESITLRETCDKLGNEISDCESTLYSLETQDIEALEAVSDSYKNRLKSLRYDGKDKRMEKMSYSEAKSFLDQLEMMDHIIETLYENYGDLLSKYLNHEFDDMGDIIKRINDVSNTLEIWENKNETLWEKINEKESYRSLGDILKKRPKECVDDACPFIAHALKWNDIRAELEELYQTSDTYKEKINELEKELKELVNIKNLYQDIQVLFKLAHGNKDNFKTYLEINLDTFYDSICVGNWNKYTNSKKLQVLTSVLSEKDLYLELTKVKLPDIENKIQLAKTSEISTHLIKRRYEDAKAEYKKALDKLQKDQSEVYRLGEALEDGYKRMERMQVLSEKLDAYMECAKELDKLHENMDRNSELISKYRELKHKKEECEYYLNEVEKTMREVTPLRDKLKFDLITLEDLRLEKDLIERDFLVVEVMRSIIAPGKGIWKEAINLYMYDIHTIANQLLLSTFDGNLYLKDFIITDKSFIIPYVYNGSEGADITLASSSQQSTICTALSLAILSKMMDKYGILTYDEVDATLSPSNKEVFVDILAKQMRFIGIGQSFIITHSPEYYEPYDVGYILFPGYKLKKRGKDYIEI